MGEYHTTAISRIGTTINRIIATYVNIIASIFSLIVERSFSFINTYGTNTGIMNKVTSNIISTAKVYNGSSCRAQLVNSIIKFAI